MGQYEESKLYRIRHSAAHVMAQAVLEMFPEAKIAIGPPIEDGFYYDFDLPRPLTPEDLEEIEKRMREIIAGDYEFVRREVSADEARHIFADQPYKLEIIQDLEKGGIDEHGHEVEGPVPITIYRHDDFVDLCRGPHVSRTGELNPDAIKLLNVAGAYWRGDERRPMLQRIYGTAWETPEELQEYLSRLEEARKRDHRRLGQALDLFSVAPDAVGPGLILWHPKGAMIRKIMEDYWRDMHIKGGYQFVYTPHIGKATLWETSGHLKWYKESMYAPMDIEGQQYYIKPMNCPFHIQIYKSRRRSFRELPLRWAELGTVYRYEKSGVVQGLTRVRGFTQDDAHIFATPDQMYDEINRVLAFCLELLEPYHFALKFELSVRDPANPEKYAGTDADWELAESTLVKALETQGKEYVRMEGEAVFYGPKIDIKAEDALGRKWQLSTIQFDFHLPEAFQMEYIGEDNRPHRPYMIHRALYGSMERFFGILIEHFGGAFPAWLAPVQIVLIPIADAQVPYAREVAAGLEAAGFRVEVNDSPDRMARKIAEATTQKVPYMLIIGKREVADGTVSVRLRTGEDLGAMSVEAFVNRAREVVEGKSLDL